MIENLQDWLDRDFPDLERRYREVEGALDINRVTALKRSSPLAVERFQKDTKTLEAILTTENPVSRGSWTEVLSLEEEGVDLSRTVNGLPLLFNHDPNTPIGTVDNVRVFGGVLRGRLKFGNSQRARDIAKDIEEGHALSMSIGYRIKKIEEAHPEHTEEEVYRVTQWELYEASVVPIPADPAATIQRNLTRSLMAGELPRTPVEIERFVRWNELRHIYEKYHKGSENSLEDYQLHHLENLDNQLLKAINDGTDSSRQAYFTDVLNMRNLQSEPRIESPHTPAAAPADFRQPGSRYDSVADRYSLQRAIAASIDPSHARHAGLEFEIADDVRRRRGNRHFDGIAIPSEMLFRDVSKAGSGGNLIGTDHLGGQFITTLREMLLLGRLGARIMPGLQGDIAIPRQTADVTAEWIGGDGSDEVTESDPAFDQVTLSPHTVGAASTFSRKTLLQSDPNIEMLIRQSIIGSLSRAIDGVSVSGDGAGNRPTGILNTPGIGSTTYSGAPSFGDVVDLEGSLSSADADLGSLAYACPALLASTLKQTETVATTGQMIWSEGRKQGEGRMNGHKALTSNLIPAGYLLFGNWVDLIIGLWSGIDLVVDPYTNAKSGSVTVVAFQDCDVAVRHPESFAEIHSA